MKKNKLIFLIVLFLLVKVHAQEYTLTGNIVNDSEEPVSYVTLIAKPTDTQAPMKFTTSDDTGAFELNLDGKYGYQISISSLSYEDYTFNIPIGNDQLIEKKIILKEKVDQLEEVLIEIPIQTKQDTTIYKTNQFVTGEEVKLKDVLEKLPGIDVDDDGNVTSKGEKVTHVLVENKKFFGGKNTKIAVDNIPADAVGSVEIIDDYNEVGLLKGMNRSNDIAMNIKLKKGKKRFVFGDAEAGVGNDDFYNLNANVFYYDPKININTILGSNNIGRRNFTYQDYQSFSGGPSNVFNAKDFTNHANQLGDLMESKDEYKSHQNTGAINLTKEISKKVDVSTYFVYSESESTTLDESLNEYLIPQEEYSEIIRNHKNNDRSSIVGAVKGTFKPNIEEEIKIDLFAKTNVSHVDKLFTSDIGTLSKSIGEDNQLDELYFNGNMEWHKKFSKKYAFSFDFNNTYDDIDSDNSWLSSYPILQDLIPYINESDYKLNLLRDTKKNITNAIFKQYLNLLNNQLLIHFTVANQNQKIDFQTTDYQLLNDGSINDFTSSGFNNDLSFRMNDFYVGAYANMRVKKFEFVPTLYTHYYNWSANNFNKYANNKIVLLPGLDIVFDNASRGKFKLGYNATTNFANVEKLANRFYIESYNAIVKGNEQLENELNHNFKFSYSRFNLIKKYYFLFVTNYSFKEDGIISYMQTSNENNYLTYQLVRNPEKSLNNVLIFDKRYHLFRYTIKLNHLMTAFIQRINGIETSSLNNSGSYDISVRNSHKNAPIINLGFKQSVGGIESDNQTHTFVTYEPYLKLNYKFLKRMNLLVDYRYYNYSNKTLNQTNTYSLLDTKLSYLMKNEKLGANIGVYNLLDVNYKNSNTIGTYIVTDSRTYILPRRILFSLTYKF